MPTPPPPGSPDAASSAAPEAPAPDTVTLFGLPFANANGIEPIVDHCLSAAQQPSSDWRCVVTPNVDHLVRYERSPELRAVAEAAWLLLPDGMPIVWASRLLGTRLRQRLTGADLFAHLVPRLAADGVSTVVLASSQDVAERLERLGSALTVLVAPWFDADDDEARGALVTTLDDLCTANAAKVCVVGVSMEKHHAIAAELQRRWSADASTTRPIVMLLGASADLYVGTVRRAPNWVQRSGFEWLFRLLGNPRRLARRYLVDDPRFAVIVARELRRNRRRRRAN